MTLIRGFPNSPSVPPLPSFSERDSQDGTDLHPGHYARLQVLLYGPCLSVGGIHLREQRRTVFAEGIMNALSISYAGNARDIRNHCYPSAAFVYLGKIPDLLICVGSFSRFGFLSVRF
jgi:hypothetical protein